MLSDEDPLDDDPLEDDVPPDELLPPDDEELPFEDVLAGVLAGALVVVVVVGVVVGVGAGALGVAGAAGATGTGGGVVTIGVVATMVVTTSVLAVQESPLPAMQVLMRHEEFVVVPPASTPLVDAAEGPVAAVPLLPTTVPNSATREGEPALPATISAESPPLPGTATRMPSPERPPVFCCRIAFEASKLVGPLTMNNCPLDVPPKVGVITSTSNLEMSLAAFT